MNSQAKPDIMRAVEIQISKIEHRYTAENDMPPGPPVTWAEYDLALAVRRLAETCAMQQERIDNLGKHLSILSELCSAQRKQIDQTGNDVRTHANEMGQMSRELANLQKAYLNQQREIGNLQDNIRHLKGS